MAARAITGTAFDLAELFDHVTYGIEYYQREYAWSADDVRTLLTDLFEEFERADELRRHRRRGETAHPFFLGPFVYAEESGRRRFLVDGQQRFTTLHLIFLHLLRQLPGTARSKTRDQLTRVIVAGYDRTRPRFRMDIDERQEALEALLEQRSFEVPANASLSVRALWQRSLQIEEGLAARLDSDSHPRFVDWLLSSVVMVGIEAVDRNNGFRIFESMNDRGARLTPVDLLKSFLLSRANSDEEKLNARWRDMLAEVTRVRGDSAAPREYLKAALIAQRARLDPGSSDAEEIDNALHVWVRSNTDHLDLQENDDSYTRFIENLVSLGKHYAMLAAATVHPFHDNGLAAIFYNHTNGLTAQMALILAAVQPYDTLSEVQEKARVAANFVDLLYVTRAVHDEPTYPAELNAEILSFIPTARACPTAAELAAALGSALPGIGVDLDFDVVRTFGLRGDNRPQVRYLLARLTAYVEEQMGKSNDVETYLAPERPWQIEHLFANHVERHPELDELRFRLLRNRLGGLGMLQPSDNASVQDLPFGEKTKWYARHNVLLGALAPDYERRHPALGRLRTSHGLAGHLRGFGASTPLQKVVEARSELYRLLFQKVWDPARLHLVVPTERKSEDGNRSRRTLTAPTPTKPSRRRRTDLAILVASGRIKPGTRLVGHHKGTNHEVRVDERGTLWLSDDDACSTPDEAGRMVTGRKTCTGMTFWTIAVVDGSRVTLRTFRDDPKLTSA